MVSIIVTNLSSPVVEEQPVEIVERKGIGHPDSLCDGIAEHISVEYTRWCREHSGVLLHHNFDKVQLVAGEVDVHYGGGEMLKPIRIQIAGRGTTETPDGRPIPVHLIAINAAKDYLRHTMHYLNPDRHCVIDCYAGPGVGELARTVEQVTANDTSIGVGHWPLSLLETAVLQSCKAINEQLIEQFPIGEDVKVMGVRLGEEISLTCAVPFLAEAVQNEAEYQVLKAAVREAIAMQAQEVVVPRPVLVHLNTADNENTGDVYLTLTGTSAEQGDDGAVGRGNRVTGLITPFRPNSLEAAAGKNAISHVGKLYNVLALEAAKTIVNQVVGIDQAQVYLLSQIGRSLDEPFVASVSVKPTRQTLDSTTICEVKAVMNNCLRQVDKIREKIIHGDVPLF